MKKWYANVSVIITIVISLLGVAVSGLLFLLIPQPSEVMSLAQRRAVGIKTVKVETDISWRGEKKGVDGTVREADEWSSSFAHDLTVPGTAKSAGNFRLSAGADSPLVFKGDRTRIGDAQFLNFSELPEQIGTLHFSEFRSKWLRVESGAVFREVSLPLLGGAVPALTPEKRAALADEFRRTPFLAVTEKLSSESLDGMPTHHYKVRPEPLYLKDFYINAESARLGRDLTGKERLAADAFFADLSPEDGEIWIGKRDFLPRRLRLRFHFDDGARNGTLSLTLAFSEYNRPVKVSGPGDEVTDVSAILASLILGAREHLPMAKDGSANIGALPETNGLGALVAPDMAELDADKDGLSDSLEVFYGSDRGNADTDGDGVSDGEEVSRGLNPTGAGFLFDFTGGRF